MDTQYFSQATDTISEPYEMFDLKLKDDQLVRMVGDTMQESQDHWNKYPYEFNKADEQNIKYWLGDQMGTNGYQIPSGQTIRNMGNRLGTSTRAVLAYVNARVANPEVMPSTGRKEAQLFAKDVADAMHQHSIDNDLEEKAGKATQSLVLQKRGYLKQRFDPLVGPYGDIVIDYVPPEDIVIDKDAAWNNDPSRIWHKQEATVEELCLKFPDKKDAIKTALGIERGTYRQMSRRETYYEVWFTYYDNNARREGLCWYLPTGKLILGKMQNPNYIYTGDDAKDRMINFLPYPPKPFVVFSYMNSGKALLDETSLFEQAKSLQDLYNTRRKQIFINNDNMGGRHIVDLGAMNEEDVVKFFKRLDKGVLGIKPGDGKTVDNVYAHVPHNPLPPQSYDEAIDLRNEIDTSMGTPNIFRGDQSKNNTLGQDERIIEQAGALQDDLARAIDKAMQRHYRLLFQMFKAYYTEDHWFTIKGETGAYDYVVLSSDTMDTNAKVSVESGSTLPANKREVRDIAVEAAGANKIDDLSFWEAVVYGKLPDPETIVERLQKQLNDPASFMADVAKEVASRDAMVDISLLIADKAPPERDEYNADYLNSFNTFVMGNRFIQLPPEAQERIKIHIASAGSMAARTVNLGDTQQEPGGMEQQLMDQEMAGQPMPEQAAMPNEPMPAVEQPQI